MKNKTILLLCAIVVASGILYPYMDDYLKYKNIEMKPMEFSMKKFTPSNLIGAKGGFKLTTGTSNTLIGYEAKFTSSGLTPQAEKEMVALVDSLLNNTYIGKPAGKPPIKKD